MVGFGVGDCLDEAAGGVQSLFGQLAVDDRAVQDRCLLGADRSGHGELGEEDGCVGRWVEGAVGQHVDAPATTWSFGQQGAGRAGGIGDRHAQQRRSELFVRSDVGAHVDHVELGEVELVVHADALKVTGDQLETADAEVYGNVSVEGLVGVEQIHPVVVDVAGGDIGGMPQVVEPVLVQRSGTFSLLGGERGGRRDGERGGEVGSHLEEVGGEPVGRGIGNGEARDRHRQLEGALGTQVPEDARQPSRVVLGGAEEVEVRIEVGERCLVAVGVPVGVDQLGELPSHDPRVLGDRRRFVGWEVGELAAVKVDAEVGVDQVVDPPLEVVVVGLQPGFDRFQRREHVMVVVAVEQDARFSDQRAEPVDGGGNRSVRLLQFAEQLVRVVHMDGDPFAHASSLHFNIFGYSS